MTGEHRQGGAIRAGIAIALCAGALGLAACGDDDPSTEAADSTSTAQTTAEEETTTTTTTTEAEATEAASSSANSAGAPEARVKEIVACLEGEGFEAIENPGNSSLGEEFNLIVGGSISVMHVYADPAAAEKNLAKVEQAATQPADVELLGDVVLEVRTSSAFDTAAIEESRAASTTCAA